MKVFEYDLDKNFYFPPYILEGESVCFLDIETDGLSHVHNNIVLVGLLIHSKSHTKIVQLFCEKLDDEHKLILALSKLLQLVDTIVTYNGTSFDIPFIRKKLLKYDIDDFFKSLSHIDLYNKVRQCKKDLNLKNCKLKTVEEKLGIYREDSISGQDSVLLYRQYLSNPSYSLQKTILKHNYDDVYYLPDIFYIEKLLDISDTISLKSGDRFIKVILPTKSGLRLKKNSLQISCTSPIIDANDIISYEDIYTLHWNKRGGRILIDLCLESEFLENDSLSYYLRLSDLNFSSTNFSNDICTLFTDKSPNRANIVYLVSLILNKWT